MARRAILLGAVLAGLVLAASGCGGGDDEASDAGTMAPVTETTEPGTTEATTEETTETESAAGGGISDADCEKVGTFAAEFFETVAAVAPAGPGGNAESASALLQELVGDVPDELADDLATMARAWAEITVALEETDLTRVPQSPADFDKLQALTSKVDTPELRQARTNVQNWVEMDCRTDTTTQP